MKNHRNRTAGSGWMVRLVRFGFFRIEAVLAVLFLGGLAFIVFCLYQALNQHLIEGHVVRKGDSSPTSFVEERDQTILLDVGIEIRTKEGVGATSPNDDPAKLSDLTIILKKSDSSSLHRAKPITRLVLTGRRASIRNVTLGDIIDQLSATSEPFHNQANQDTEK